MTPKEEGSIKEAPHERVTTCDACWISHHMSRVEWVTTWQCRDERPHDGWWM